MSFAVPRSRPCVRRSTTGRPRVLLSDDLLRTCTSRQPISKRCRDSLTAATRPPARICSASTRLLSAEPPLRQLAVTIHGRAVPAGQNGRSSLTRGRSTHGSTPIGCSRSPCGHPDSPGGPRQRSNSGRLATEIGYPSRFPEPRPVAAKASVFAGEPQPRRLLPRVFMQNSA
jgi:hypothetical protein